MKKALLVLAALSVLWFVQGTDNEASAHGGAYRGPAGEVPPGQRDPKDPQPPPEAPGTPTPGGPPDGTPRPDPGEGSGGDDPPPEEPKGPPPAPGGPVAPGGPGGIATPGGKRPAPKMMSFENWLFWWAYNKDEILNLKARVKAMEDNVATDDSARFFGGKSGRTGKQAPTEQAIKEDIVPALKEVVNNKEIHPDIRGGALIALSRTGGGAEHVKTFFEVSEKDSGEDKVVQESAILALGILQLKNEQIRNHLIKLVDDQDYPMRGRCFAMLALGILQDNHEEVFAALERRLDGREVHQDVPVCALLSIGLIGDEKKVPDLIGWLEAGKIGSQKVKDLERAWIISSLGKIKSAEALKPITKVLRQRGIYAVRSAAIALGQLVPQAEPKVQEEYATALMRFHKSAGDLTAKNFAVISLGRIAGQEGVSPKVRDGVEKFLTQTFKDSNKTTERPFAALAMGLVGFESGKDSVKPQELKYRLSQVIYNQLKELKGDKTALGAQAIALGMIGDRDKKVVDLLIKILKDRGMEKNLRGSAAMALGLLGDNAAREAIMSALQEREDRDLRVDTAVAAGLLGDSNAVTTLVKVLNDPKASQFVLGSVALALGQIGDKQAIEPLLTILEPSATNGKYPDLTRALVAVALGQLSDRRDIRVLSRISKDINYRASVPALDEILTIL